MNRRNFLSGAGAAALGCAGTPQEVEAKTEGPSPADLDRAAAAPVLKRDGLSSPVVIDSIRLVKRDQDYLVHIRSKD